MAIVTVVGASAGSTINVTVDGAATGSLGTMITQYSDVLAAGLASKSITGQVLSQSSASSQTLLRSVNTPTDSSSSTYGVITTGGAYVVSGNTGYVTFGAPGDVSSNTLGEPVYIDVAGSTAKQISVEGGSRNGAVLTAGSSGGTYVAGTGDNMFIGGTQSGASGWSVTTGDGNDTVIAGNGSNSIAAGAGENTIILNNGLSTVNSTGNDTIVGTASDQHVNLLGGKSTVQIGSSAFVHDESANNRITVGGASTVLGGTTGTIALGGTSGTVAGGTNDTISASGDATVALTNGGSISTGGALSFLNGTGQTTITAAGGTIFGAGGLDAITNSTTTNPTASLMFVANSGNETLDGANSQNGLVAFGNTNLYSGSQVFIGGTASDTLAAGVGDATLTGGSGASNVFAFRDGVAGGNYTITDFNAASGNVVFLYGYGANEVQNALGTAQATGGSTTIQLSDNSRITFQNVTSLNQSDFFA
ncbi:calcium-binding protein [Acetobacter sp. AN02]|uniref:beta strand repeat-containing protein n=1 Tax=Acetobacter sp. AN02 TaxID=2894186 RepID=UPI002434444C|nr:calcium-binding protein [Acetobacter sp. AN02]MDG6094356.1 calcium-binding protein [Acetobacter sp. AN02]